MRNFTERISGITFTLSCMAGMTWAMGALTLGGRIDEISCRVLILILFAVCLYLLDSFFVKRGSRVNVLLIVHMLCMAAGICLYWFTTDLTPDAPGTKIVFAVIYALCLAAALYVAWEPLKPQSAISCFDIMAVLLILHMAMRQILGVFMTGKVVAACAVAMAAALITTTKMRIDKTKESGASIGSAYGGKVFLVILAALILAIAAIIAAAASGALSSLSSGLLSLLKAAWAGILFVLSKMYAVVIRFMNWLTKFINTDMDTDSLIEEEGIDSLTNYDEATESSGVPVWFIIAVAAVIAAIVVIICIRLRKVRINSETEKAASSGEITRSGGLRKAVAAWIGKIRDRFAFYINYRKKINTPAGMLIWCERHFKKSCSRETGEGGPAYLRRLALESERENISAELMRMADLTESAFYAPSYEAESEAAALAARIRAGRRRSG